MHNIAPIALTLFAIAGAFWLADAISGILAFT
jgi:hypothetical protein